MNLFALAAVLALAGSACKSAGPAQPASPSTTAPPSAALIAKACHVEHAGPSSTVFLALDPSGQLTRLVVTPHGIADLGNLIVDLNGAVLGVDTGSEFPWEDAAALATERARVAALMGGAAVPQGAAPIACSS